MKGKKSLKCYSVQFSSVAQSCPTLCDPMNRTRQASMSITNSRSSLRLTSIKSVMPSSHLILCHPLLLLPPIPSSIRVFSNESTQGSKRRKWQPTPGLLPGKFHGWRSVIGYSPWGCKESDTTEQLHLKGLKEVLEE